MRKSFTKILCAAVAAISVISVAALPACSNKWSGTTMDNSGNVTSNGGFVVETQDYVYFVNGAASNTDDNTFGSVVKGSLQRIKKTELKAHNYSNTDTVVPQIIYSGNKNAGVYIYGDYVYYTTPSTEKNLDGDVQNTNLDFKRTKLDGSDTTKGYIYSCTSNAVDYRYVKVGDTVYILYALSENLYDDGGVTNIHSVNCTTGEDVILAYNVEGYSFDTQNPESPYVYYVMSVLDDVADKDSKMKYNQLYRVRADAPAKQYDFSAIEDYDAEKNPVYINRGQHVFDGIGQTAYTNYGFNQFNYGYGANKTYDLSDCSNYGYSIKWYKDGYLYYNRTNKQTSKSNLYRISDSQLNGEDGNIKADWDAITKNAEQLPFIYGDVSTEYTFINKDGKVYALSSDSSGIKRNVVKDGVLEDEVVMCGDPSVSIITVIDEEHLNLYYSMSDGVYRLAVDGSYDDYRKLPVDEDAKLEYSHIKLYDIKYKTSWFAPEFVGNTLLFASDVDNMADFGYIMALDLTGENGKMSNKEIKAVNEKIEALNDKIKAYDDEENSDGTAAYEHLSNALKYLYYTGDVEYIDELVKANIDVFGRDEEYAYSKASVAIFKDYAATKGDWADYAEDTNTVNGKAVSANFSDYYYSLVGKMTDTDAEKLKKANRDDYMEEYPVDNSTWWEKLSTGGKAGFIVGMSVLGLGVIAGAVILTVFLVKRKRSGVEECAEGKSKVDITDDKNLDVYEN